MFCKRITDYFNNLKGKEVIIFGASLGGLNVSNKLKKYGIKVKCFTDNNSNLWGSTLNDICVLSMNEALSLCKENLDGIIIQIASGYEVEILNQLLNMNIKNEIYTYLEFYFALDYQVYDNNKNLFLEKGDILEKLEFENDKRNAVNAIINSQRYGENNICMLFNSKVFNGINANSLKDRIQNFIEYSDGFGSLDNRTKDIAFNNINKIIIEITEPSLSVFNSIFIKDINNTLHCNNYHEYYLNLLNKELKRKKDIASLLKDKFDFNINDINLNDIKQYKIIKNNNVEILLCKTSKCKNVEKVINDFLGLGQIYYSNHVDFLLEKSYKSFFDNFQCNVINK